MIETLDENFRIERNLPVEEAKKYQAGQPIPIALLPARPAMKKSRRAQLKRSARSLALLIPAGLSDAYDTEQTDDGHAALRPDG